MKVILSGGGTGGHVTPALAIGDGLKKYCENCEILFIGREGGYENRAVVKANYKIETLVVNGLKRKPAPSNIKNIIIALRAERKACGLIKDFKPDVVIGTGGYVCWPVIRAAQKLNIPTVIHESNFYPGLVTRMLSKKCEKVLINHPESKKYFKRRDNICAVGNPLRDDFEKIKRSEARERLGIKEDEIYIVSFGGSGGAEIINDTVLSVMKNYCSKNKRIKHLHSCGKRYIEKYRSEKLCSERCQIREYIDDMPLNMKAADIVICRCGAMTLSEIAFCEVAAILIPSPNVTDNHQYKNAKYYSDQKAAILIEEKNLTEKSLTDEIDNLIQSDKLRKNLSVKISQLCKRNAANKASKIIASTAVSGKI